MDILTTNESSLYNVTEYYKEDFHIVRYLFNIFNNNTILRRNDIIINYINLGNFIINSSRDNSLIVSNILKIPILRSLSYPIYLFNISEDCNCIIYPKYDSRNENYELIIKDIQNDEKTFVWGDNNTLIINTSLSGGSYHGRDILLFDIHAQNKLKQFKCDTDSGKINVKNINPDDLSIMPKEYADILQNILIADKNVVLNNLVGKNIKLSYEEWLNEINEYLHNVNMFNYLNNIEYKKRTKRGFAVSCCIILLILLIVFGSIAITYISKKIN